MLLKLTVADVTRKFCMLEAALLRRWLTPMDLWEWVKAAQVFPGRTNEFLPGDPTTVQLKLQQPLKAPPPQPLPRHVDAACLGA